MSTSFACVLIGRGPQLVACADHLLRRTHRIQSVVSDCPVVAAWAQRHGVERLEPGDDCAALLRRQPFDYLFSIVNHAVTPAAVLELPRFCAINYHDSRLPAYSGFHATTWAILDGQTEHGITWHRMTTAVDAGPYLLQRSFPVTDQDTAFSLAARASELATRSFVDLLIALETGSATASPGLAAQHFHRKSDRPGFVVLDWTEPETQILRTVRAFDFGSEDNWLTRAKLKTPSGDFLCVGTASPTRTGSVRPGTVVSANAGGVTVQTVDAAVLLADLTTLDGDPVGDDQFGRFGLIAGAALPGHPNAQAEAAVRLDREVTKAERFWLQRLRRLAIPQLSELQAHAPAGPRARVSVPLAPKFLAQSVADQQAMLLAGLAVYATRVHDGSNRVDLPVCVASLPAELTELYSPAVPLAFEIDPQASWLQALQQARQELVLTKARGTYARDIWTRYHALRSRPASDRQMALAVAFGPATQLALAQPALPAGARLLVTLLPGATELVLDFDTNAIGKLAAERLGARLVHLLEAAGANAGAAVADLDIVPAAERAQLLQAFQETSRPAVEIACIHDLFAAQVRRTPDNVALVYRKASITYRELDERAEALAQHLRALGVGPDLLVGIAVERSLDMVVGLLAILKAGGAYVPLDPAYPTERLAMMLEDSGARWLLTQRHLETRLPRHGATVVLVDAARQVTPVATTATAAIVAARPANLAYVIFTSGSTGRPKGVMVEHRNVANFFAGMDERLGRDPGVWLAVTSISFDISVLEIFWTLTRGFETVIQEEGDRASLLKSQAQPVATSRPMGFGLFYFAADSTNAAATNAYRLLLDGARFADSHDFVAVWTPERHFHAFGGLYPNAAVTSAAIASITSRVELRAGSVVIPLHDPIRVAEEWAVVDNLSQGRVGLSFASGWHANDFALKPENYERRREVMQESIDTVLRLWAGEKIKVKNGVGQEIEVSVLPRPVRTKPPMWIASAGNIETFRAAGRAGYNILTNMLGQDLKDLGTKFAAYREARREHGHAGEGIISVMLHTFVTDDDERAKQLARGPFGNYLTTSYDLVKVAPWMFPAFKRPSAAPAGTAGAASEAFAPDRFDAEDMQALLDHAFERYFDTAGLFGTPRRALKLIEQLKDIGATEVACLIDFGIAPDVVLENLVHLDELRRLANPGSDEVVPSAPVSIREQFERRRITHFQCTPSMARILVADGTMGTMQSLRKFMIGGEALTQDLAGVITAQLPAVELVNMYGPTETTVWSTTAAVDRGNPANITIGRPIANTQIRILDARLRLLPLGTPGELCIGGAGVVRGYLHRPDLTAERFVSDPFQPGNRLYRTGDLARYREEGTIEYLGRLDQQVKVNGYRIELGEIEAVLGKHPSVQQAVVAARSNHGAVRLVGYVVPAGRATAVDAGSAAGIADWQSRWDTAYATRVGAADAPARCNTSGWLSSYTGEPIATAAMREWLDRTTERILALRPRRVLEIGCGTGMILYACLEHVDHYTAMDLSPVALESIRCELHADERRKVVLLQGAADRLEAVPDQSCDLVIINSVAQYFPSADYLTRVLEQAARVLVDGGSIFLGDVRCLEVAALFHTLVELHKAPGQTTAAALATRIAERESLDTELLLGKHYFGHLEQRVPRLSLVSMQAKHGLHATEMRDFRCDVVLRAGVREPVLDLAKVPELVRPESMERVRQALVSQPPVLRLTGVRNVRLDRALEGNQIVQRREPGTTAEALLKVLQQPARGIDPEEVHAAHADYDVELRMSDEVGCFDALLRHRQQAPVGTWAPPQPLATRFASTPYRRVDAEALPQRLRAHLREFLPEYMVPEAFVLLDSLPLTPNGKIDRKALPDPVEAIRTATAEHVVPANNLERTIAGVWQDVLGLERVGRKDNIFDLGASSLLTVEANSRLQDVLGQKIPLVTMFRFPTIESLAGHLAKTMAPATPDSGTAGASPTDDERQNRLAAAAERRRQARARNS